LPLGEHTKRQVRQLARERKLPVAEREDSQDLCFVGDGDYGRFLAEHMPQAVRPGPIYDSSGRELGQHRGLARYTIGQRKGLGITAPERLYVLELDPAANALIVGPAAELGRDVCLARDVNWVAGEPPGQSFEATAKIRYKARDVAVSVSTLDDDDALVQFERPQRDITPGQAIVFYQGQVVLGGGTIDWKK
jgi:tRNA-specific 2-thiouridylase